MARLFLRTFILTVCVIFWLGSCAKEEGGTDARGTPQEEPKLYGYLIRDGRALYHIDDAAEGGARAEWSANLDLGERVEVVAQGARARTQDGEYTFVEAVRENGQRGHIIDFHVAVGASLAVVLEDSTLLYKTPRFSGVWSYSLPRGAVIAHWPESERDGFVKIQAFHSYDANANMYFPATNSASVPEVYLLKESVSAGGEDVQAAILLFMARNARNEERRNTLLDAALRGYPSSAFTGDIRALRFPGEASGSPAGEPGGEALGEEPSPAPALFTIQPWEGQYYVNAGAAGEILMFDGPQPPGEETPEPARLADGLGLRIIARTGEEATVGGERAAWYRVETPGEQTGWVFGANLRPLR